MLCMLKKHTHKQVSFPITETLVSEETSAEEGSKIVARELSRKNNSGNHDSDGKEV